jgi:hypothetical protein
MAQWRVQRLILLGRFVWVEEGWGVNGSITLVYGGVEGVFRRLEILDSVGLLD